jgi:hypothetical protein
VRLGGGIGSHPYRVLSVREDTDERVLALA